MANKALAAVQEFEFPAVSDRMAEAYAEEMDGIEFSFDRVKIPAGGGLAFEIPGDDPENPETTKEIVGVIVDHHRVNAYWDEKYSGQNNPPDCSSLDGKAGVGRDGGNQVPCNSCPFNAWGSDESGGKACKNMRRIYILRSGETLPLLLTLPPTSLKNFGDYLAKRIIGKGRRSYEVLTKVTLKKAKNAGGIEYSQAQFAVAGVLPEKLAAQAETMAKRIRPMTRALDIADDEYYQPASADEAVDEDSPI